MVLIMIKCFLCVLFCFIWLKIKKNKFVWKGVIYLKKFLKIVFICVLVVVGIVGGFLVYMIFIKE